jgi:hypothetical protein
MVHDQRTFRHSRAGVLGGVTAGAVVLSLVEVILDKELTVRVFVAGATGATGGSWCRVWLPLVMWFMA